MFRIVNEINTITASVLNQTLYRYLDLTGRIDMLPVRFLVLLCLKVCSNIVYGHPVLQVTKYGQLHALSL